MCGVARGGGWRLRKARAGGWWCVGQQGVGMKESGVEQDVWGGEGIFCATLVGQAKVFGAEVVAVGTPGGKGEYKKAGSENQ